MPRKKQKDDVTIDLRQESGLAEFVRRPVASEKEVKAFEESLDDEEGSYDDDYEEND